jgi:CheY-like chemotaxis protein
VTISFSVKDTGIGISEEKHKNIFNEFTQIESQDYTYQGTGLGLPIVKKLLNLSNSDIQLESELGKGTTFSFDLDFQIASEMLANEQIALIDESVIEGKNILIVEDNRINQIVTKKILEKKGANCSVVENGQLAIDICKNQSFHLVLMDLNMPVKDGIEATSEIRVFNKEVPIIALTAVEAEEVRSEVVKAGMNDIIIKPYDLNKFTQVIIKNITEGKGSLFNRSKKAI